MLRRVTISHTEYRRGSGNASPFIDDIPASHRVDGWLRVKQAGADLPLISAPQGSVIRL